MKNSYSKNKLQIKSFLNNVKFFFIRDLVFVIREFYLHFIAFNIILSIFLDYFKSEFSVIYSGSLLLFMLSIIILCIMLFLKTSKANKFTDLQISEINSETLTNTWSKINQIVIKILLMLIAYFVQLYFQLNVKLFYVEPVLAVASFEVMKGCFMYVLAVMLTYFTYQSRLFLIAYESKIM
ncbi:MAG: hypothetical protein K2Q03_06665 [Sphingobacteriaceae bacterium]|nr:hypothetical protein [Sphingobacteriaceae bacterium]